MVHIILFFFSFAVVGFNSMVLNLTLTDLQRKVLALLGVPASTF